MPPSLLRLSSRAQVVRCGGRPQSRACPELAEGTCFTVPPRRGGQRDGICLCPNTRRLSIVAPGIWPLGIVGVAAGIEDDVADRISSLVTACTIVAANVHRIDVQVRQVENRTFRMRTVSLRSTVEVAGPESSHCSCRTDRAGCVRGNVSFGDCGAWRSLDDVQVVARRWLGV